MRHRGRERERQRHRPREKQAPRRDPDAGLEPGTPGSRPQRKAALTAEDPGPQPEPHPDPQETHGACPPGSHTPEGTQTLKAVGFGGAWVARLAERPPLDLR